MATYRVFLALVRIVINPRRIFGLDVPEDLGWMSEQWLAQQRASHAS